MTLASIAVYSKDFKGLPNGWKQILPVTFVVGDNSTGKTSLLDLISILDSPEFNFTNQAIGIIPEAKEAIDVVSKFGSGDSLTIGYLKRRIDDGDEYTGKIVSYRHYRNTLVISALTSIHGHSAFRVKLTGKKFLAKRFDSPRKTVRMPHALALAERAHFDSGKKYTQISTVESEKAGEEDWFMAAVGATMALGDDPKKRATLKNTFGSLETTPFKSLRYGPIRGETQKLYSYSAQKDFDPSGTHFPHRLHTISQKSSELISLIRQFGKESGLFEDVRIEKFKGASGAEAFSIVYKKYGRDFFGNELGYGLGQIIPIATDLLLARAGSTFLVQQPEVHLHPKAQAAFGSLLFRVAKKGLRIVAETHSDFIIDRYRIEQAESREKIDSQILFFEKRSDSERPTFSTIRIGETGNLEEAPDTYREFFIKESMAKLEKL